MKNILRKEAVKKRKTLDLKTISLEICKNISNLKEYQSAKKIAIFYSKDIEINLLSLLDNTDKNFYLPKIENHLMNFYFFENKNDLKTGKFNILEPTSNILEKNPDIIITPCLLADKQGYRLGWGGGFYDKYLQNYQGIKICVVPDCQIIDNLPVDKYDIPCDIVVSEKQIIKSFTRLY